MIDEKEAKVLVQYIRSLTDLQFVGPEVPYGHMGATITDAMLQPGVRYDTVVWPRVKNLLEQYPEAKTTSGFLKLTKKVDIKTLVNWKSSEKPNRILGVLDFFNKEGIETEAELRLWLDKKGNLEKLDTLRGIGNKTMDYFKILSGIPAVAVDRYLSRFVEQAGITGKTYSEARDIISLAAEQIGVDKSTLDHSIWKYLSTEKRGKKLRNKCMA
jgi:endonuclease III